MRRKRIFAALVAVVLILLCCGCGKAPEPDAVPGPTVAPPPTPEAVLHKMQLAVLETPCTQVAMSMNFNVSIEIPDTITFPVRLGMDMEMTTGEGENNSHLLLSLDASVMGEETQTQVESYTVTEEGALTTYSCFEGVWTRAEVELPEQLPQAPAFNRVIDRNTLWIDSSVTRWEEKDVICLVCAIPGGNIRAQMGPYFQSLGEDEEIIAAVEDLPWENINYNLRLYLDPGTMLPLGEDVILDGIDDFLGDLLRAMLEDVECTLEVTDCAVTMRFLSYEPQGPVEVPQEVREEVALWERLAEGGPDNGDGTFTFWDGEALLVDITPPEGFELWEMDDNYLYFADPENAREFVCQLLYLPDEDYTELVEEWVSGYEAYGAAITRERSTVETESFSFTCDHMLATYPDGHREALIQCWTVLSDGNYLAVDIYDGVWGEGFAEKNTDITAEEIAAYLNAAAPSKWMD